MIYEWWALLALNNSIIIRFLIAYLPFKNELVWIWWILIINICNIYILGLSENVSTSIRLLIVIDFIVYC